MWQHTVIAKRPRDPNQLAKLIVDIATGEAEDTVSDSNYFGMSRLVHTVRPGNVIDNVVIG